MHIRCCSHTQFTKDPPGPTRPTSGNIVRWQHHADSTTNKQQCACNVHCNQPTPDLCTHIRTFRPRHPPLEETSNMPDNSTTGLCPTIHQQTAQSHSSCPSCLLIQSLARQQISRLCEMWHRSDSGRCRSRLRHTQVGFAESWLLEVQFDI